MKNLLSSFLITGAFLLPTIASAHEDRLLPPASDVEGLFDVVIDIENSFADLIPQDRPADLLLSVLKTRHDTVKNAIGNIR